VNVTPKVMINKFLALLTASAVTETAQQQLNVAFLNLKLK
jgi:hypothetical protein